MLKVRAAVRRSGGAEHRVAAVERHLVVVRKRIYLPDVERHLFVVHRPVRPGRTGLVPQADMLVYICVEIVLTRGGALPL